MKWYLEVLTKYAVFTGRARRKEYWFFVLFNMLVSIVLVVIDGMIGFTSSRMGVGVLTLVYSLGVLIPSIAVSVRRLHDTSHSAWWLLISLIPLIGSIILIVFMATDSTPGQNSYGLSPKSLLGMDATA